MTAVLWQSVKVGSSYLVVFCNSVIETMRLWLGASELGFREALLRASERPRALRAGWNSPLRSAMSEAKWWAQ